MVADSAMLREYHRREQFQRVKDFKGRTLNALSVHANMLVVQYNTKAYYMLVTKVKITKGSH